MMTGGWILAALVLLGNNGLELTAVLEPSVSGHSDALKTVKEKLKELKEKAPLSNDGQMEFTGFDLKLAGFTPKLQKQGYAAVADTVMVPKENSATEIKKKQIIIPHVSGIVQVTGINGDFRFSAMIEGKLLSKNDRINGFTVRQITQEGITLRKNGKDFFVRVPRTGFSMIRSVNSGTKVNKPIPAAEGKGAQ